jgi:hypothetical protein
MALETIDGWPIGDELMNPHLHVQNMRLGSHTTLTKNSKCSGSSGTGLVAQKTKIQWMHESCRS